MSRYQITRTERIIVEAKLMVKQIVKVIPEVLGMLFMLIPFIALPILFG